MRTTALALLGVSLLAGPALGQTLSERVAFMQQRAQTRSTSRAHLLSVLTYTDVTMQLQETPARDAFNELQRLLGISIVARYNDDKVGLGIDPNTPISFDVTDKPALTVLELILDQCEDIEACTWQLRDGFVEVGTKQRLNLPAAREIKYYPIRDLLFEPPYFDNAPTLDLETALNQSQGSGGGGGGGSGGGGGGFGGGGGSGGGGGGGGGGSIIGESEKEKPRKTEAEKVEDLIDLITGSVETEAWDVNGGDAATIKYYQGVLIIRAPDYIHRQLGGYPYAVRPIGGATSAPRYLSFTGAATNVELADIREVETGGAAGTP